MNVSLKFYVKKDVTATVNFRTKTNGRGLHQLIRKTDESNLIRLRESQEVAYRELRITTTTAVLSLMC